MPRKLDERTESRIVVLLARGFKQSEIIEDLKEKGTTISAPVISNVKKRNKKALIDTKQALINRELDNIYELHQKSAKLLNKKLNKAVEAEDEEAIITKRFKDGHIDYKEYQSQLKGLRNRMTTNELVSINRESAEQMRKTEDGGVIKDPEQAQKELEMLNRALESGDEVALERIVWKKSGLSEPDPAP